MEKRSDDLEKEEQEHLVGASAGENNHPLRRLRGRSCPRGTESFC